MVIVSDSTGKVKKYFYLSAEKVFGYLFSVALYIITTEFNKIILFHWATSVS
jgi:hypothetical protein